MRVLLALIILIMTTASAGAYDAKRIDEKQLICLALNIYHEGRGEPYSGQEAIAQVVFNRIESKRFPNTVCSVVYQHKQFSWFSDGKSDKIYNQRLWEDILTRATIFYLMRGRSVDITNGSTHYHTNKVNPWWNEGMNIQVTLNRHIFYTD